MLRFGWCAGAPGARADHDACRYEIGTSDGTATCDYPCHQEDK